MQKPSYDPGFTEKYRGNLRRIINPSGEFNVRRRGTSWRDVHPYLFMINTSWPTFFALILGGYIVANALFALIYLKLGIEHLQGSDLNTPLSRFLSAFFFSAQTFTTVGYGRISPDGALTSLMASLQALLGLMALAIGTGLLFGRFSRPAARLAFSQQMVVAPYQSGTSLQFRVANRRSNNLMEIEARVMMSTVEQTEQGPLRKYKYLALERPQVQFLPLTWTIVHPIDDESPLRGKTYDDLVKTQSEFLVMIKGFDDTFFQTVHVRHSYRFEEIVWGAHFAPAFEPNDEGEMVLDLEKLSEITTSGDLAGAPSSKLIADSKEEPSVAAEVQTRES
jgi:inward rectifier potassium channel